MDMVRDPITGKPSFRDFNTSDLFKLLLAEGMAAWEAFDYESRARIEVFLTDKFFVAKEKPEPVAAFYLYEMLKRLDMTGSPINKEWSDA